MYCARRNLVTIKFLYKKNQTKHKIKEYQKRCIHTRTHTHTNTQRSRGYT
jgi:hypothetical protein